MENGIRVVTLLIIIGIALFGECCGVLVDNSEAVNALSNQGFSDIKITDKSVMFMSWRGCSESDAAKFDATAKNALGKQVNVYVCVGWPFKGATIRSY